MAEAVGDIELLNVNKNSINKNKPIGYEPVKKHKTAVRIKKTIENVAKLAVIAASAIMETPILKSGVNAIGAMEANRIIGMISKIVGNLKGLPLTDIGGQLVQSELYMNMSLPTGEYSWVGYLVQFCVNLAVNHPGVIIAGGSILAGFLTSKVIYPIIKKIARMIKGGYQKLTSKKNANEVQLKIYQDIKNILKNDNFKKIKGHQEMSKVLNDASKITASAKEYEYELLKLHDYLEKVNSQITEKKVDNYNQLAINVSTLLKEIEYKSYQDNSTLTIEEENKKKKIDSNKNKKENE